MTMSDHILLEGKGIMYVLYMVHVDIQNLKLPYIKV